VVSLALRPLYVRRKRPRYLMLKRLSGPQSRSGRGGEASGQLNKKNIVRHVETRNAYKTMLVKSALGDNTWDAWV